MATVKSDLIRDSGLEVNEGQVSITRVYAVSGLDPTDKHILTSALVAPGVPVYGEAHPVYGNAVATKFKVVPIQEGNKYFHTAAEVIVVYGTRGFAQIPVTTTVDFGSTLVQVQTDTDRNGKLLFVTWDGAKIAGDDGRQRAVYSKLVRCDTITYRHWFKVKDDQRNLDYPTPIDTLKDTFFGKVNSAPFRGKPPHCWMCTACDATTFDLGKSYELVLTLEHRPSPGAVNGGTLFGGTQVVGGFDEFAWWRDYHGEVPRQADKQKNNGVRLITEIYEEADFTRIPEALSILNLGF